MKRIDFGLEIRTRQEAIYDLHDRLKHGAYRMVNGVKTGERVPFPLDADVRARKTVKNLETQIAILEWEREEKEASESRGPRQERLENLEDAVLSCLKDGPRSTREIAEILDIRMEQARRTCKRLEQRKSKIRVASVEHSGSVKVVTWTL